jgi:phosphoadenosine phosphosulfate reductase
MITMQNLPFLNETITALRDLTNANEHVKMASSLGAEDMVLAHIIQANQLPIHIFTLDTGRLNPETYDLLAKSQTFAIRVYFPQSVGVEQFTQQFGINGFYDSVEARKACCAARKIEPLKRALQGANAWVTGLRKTQSDARQDLQLLAHDPVTNLPKCNPLLNWSEQDVWAYLNHFQVPFNALHSRGYPSIGCAPCTRAIQPGEHPRAGRWWWEEDAQKECGLHVDATGKLVRTQLIKTFEAPKKEITL